MRRTLQISHSVTTAQARAALEAAEIGLERAQSDLSERRHFPLMHGSRRHLSTRGSISSGRTIASVFSTDIAEVRLPFVDADIAAPVSHWLRG